MGRIVLVTGGSRSGKSDYATRIAMELTGPRVFVATCPALDNEMRERIRKHQEARRGFGWTTIEEPFDIAKVLRENTKFRLFLIDCLTLWVNNLMYLSESQGQDLSEEEIADRAQDVLHACHSVEGTVIFVTNEVGWGIVPLEPSARRFRDLAGRCNQIIAQGAHHVMLVVCGLPLTLKQEEEHH